LLAEALYGQKKHIEAAGVLNRLATQMPTPALEWQRQYLLALIELESHLSNAALQRTTNLVAIAAGANDALLEAKSIKLQAEILEKERPDTAVQAYDRMIQVQGLPLDEVRQAVLKSVDLLVAQSRLTDAVQRLDSY